MSMQSWTVTGFGINEDVLCGVLINNKIDFIKKYLPNIYEELQDSVEEANKEGRCDMQNTSDYLDYCDTWIDEYEDDYCNRGFGSLFADAISENEDGIDVQYCCGEYDSENSILYSDRLPWEMSERVRNMNENDMAEIFMKYLRELGINKAVCERQSVEYYG